MKFSDLGLDKDILRAIEDAGYTEPTPIQAQAIPYVLMNRDILGAAQTGTGKTASFTLPMIEVLHHGRARARMPRSLILEPTRELAAQVAANFDTYGKYHKLNKALLIGGTSMDEQVKAMDRGVDVLIATPGRLMDLFERGRILLNDVKILVIDEADRMLDMGFIPDVEKIVSLLPPLRQTLFFSATMPPEIKRLADKFLHNPKEIKVARTSSAAETVTQGLLVVDDTKLRGPGGAQKAKRSALRALIAQEEIKNAIVFCNRKRDVSTVCKSLTKHGMSAAQLHGDMSQPERMRTLESFKAGNVTIMVCSDVAARGLDIPALSHVFNYDVPTHSEDYIHRIGRTGRAGREGTAYTLVTSDDAKYVSSIEHMMGKPIPRISVDGLADGSLDGGGESRGGGRGERGERGGRGRGERGGRGRGRGERDAEPKQAAEAAAETPAETPVEAPAEKADTPEPAEQPRKADRAERSERPSRKPRRDNKREANDAGVDTSGELPAFLMRDPLANLKEEKPEKKPRKRSSPAKKAE